MATKVGQKTIGESGLVYYGLGEDSVDDGFWLRLQEFQIQWRNRSDYLCVACSLEDVKAI